MEEEHQQALWSRSQRALSDFAAAARLGSRADTARAGLHEVVRLVAEQCTSQHISAMLPEYLSAPPQRCTELSDSAVNALWSERVATWAPILDLLSKRSLCVFDDLSGRLLDLIGDTECDQWRRALYTRWAVHCLARSRIPIDIVALRCLANPLTTYLQVLDKLSHEAPSHRRPLVSAPTVFGSVSRRSFMLLEAFCGQGNRTPAFSDTLTEIEAFMANQKEADAKPRWTKAYCSGAPIPIGLLPDGTRPSLDLPPGTRLTFGSNLFKQAPSSEYVCLSAGSRKRHRPLVNSDNIAMLL